MSCVDRVRDGGCGGGKSVRAEGNERSADDESIDEQCQPERDRNGTRNRALRAHDLFAEGGDAGIAGEREEQKCRTFEQTQAGRWAVRKGISDVELRADRTSR